jgi:hypothetical protein
LEGATENGAMTPVAAMLGSGGNIARQSSWQARVNQDGKGSRGIRIMPLMIVAGKLSFPSV